MWLLLWVASTTVFLTSRGSGLHLNTYSTEGKRSHTMIVKQISVWVLLALTHWPLSFPDPWLSQFWGSTKSSPRTSVECVWDGGGVATIEKIADHGDGEAGVLKKGMTVIKRGRGGWEPRLRKLVGCCQCFKPHPLRLVSHSLCSQGWAWILNYPVSISQVLRLQPCATMPDSK